MFFPISAGSFTPGSFSVKPVIMLVIKLAVIATAETKIDIYINISQIFFVRCLSSFSKEC